MQRFLSYRQCTRFRTTLDFDREYLGNGSSNRQAINGAINVRWKQFGELWPTPIHTLWIYFTTCWNADNSSCTTISQLELTCRKVVQFVVRLAVQQIHKQSNQWSLGTQHITKGELVSLRHLAIVNVLTALKLMNICFYSSFKIFITQTFTEIKLENKIVARTSII